MGWNRKSLEGPLLSLEERKDLQEILVQINISIKDRVDNIKWVKSKTREYMVKGYNLINQNHAPYNPKLPLHL